MSTPRERRENVAPGVAGLAQRPAREGPSPRSDDPPWSEGAERFAYQSCGAAAALQSAPRPAIPDESLDPALGDSPRRVRLRREDAHEVEERLGLAPEQPH